MDVAKLITDVDAAVRGPGSIEARAKRIADLLRLRTDRRWIGIYRVTSDEVVNLAWSGPGPPAYPRFPVTRGLTGAAIASIDTVTSNDVARDPRYLTTLQSTGSELIAPVVSSNRVVGTLDVEDERTDAFDDGDRTLFEGIAAQLTELFHR